MQVLQLIAVLGEKDAGRKAILKAVAGKQGVSSEYDIDRLLDGSWRGNYRYRRTCEAPCPTLV